MDSTTIDVMRECTEGSLAGRLSFPDVIGKLMGCGVESYHVDMYRFEKTCYMPNGESHVEHMALPKLEIARDFSAPEVIDAVRDIQQRRITYIDFMHRIAAGGTARYFVYFAGRCVAYVGRDGSRHVEHFPGANR